MKDKIIWLTSKRELSLSDRPHIMGVLNVTPDSFSDGGRFLASEAAVERAWAIVDEGADIIDVGAESTRPGAEPVTAEIELERLSPVIEGLGTSFPIPVSVDTYKSDVADRVLASGAEIINDVSGLRMDPDMAHVVARHRAGLVIMHMRGNPGTMQSLANYCDLVAEVRAELEESARIAESAGILPVRIVFDPGIGFSKNHVQSTVLLNRLQQLSIMDRPLLVGLSRKSFIGKILDLPVDQRIEGTIAAGIVSLVKGAHVLRVHDVKAVKRAVEVATAILEECQNLV